MYSAIGLGIQICIETCIFPLMFFFQFSFSSQKEEVKSWAKDALAIFAVILVDLGRYCPNGSGRMPWQESKGKSKLKWKWSLAEKNYLELKLEVEAGRGKIN